MCIRDRLRCFWSIVDESAKRPVISSEFKLSTMSCSLYFIYIDIQYIIKLTSASIKDFFLFCRGNLLQKLRGKCMNNLRTSPLSSSKNLPLYFFMVLLLNRLYGVDAPGWPRPPPQTTSRIRSSAITEGPRDASCQLKSCQLPRNSAETTYTSPDQIDGMQLET